MPQLIMFAPCAKAIQDGEDRTVSLISVIDGIQVEIPPSGVAKDTVIPMPWATVATWLRTPEDQGKSFEQRISIITPDGTESIDGSIPFQMTERLFRGFIRLNAFPAGQQGEYRIRVSLRDVSEGDKWTAKGEYPVLVLHEKRVGT